MKGPIFVKYLYFLNPISLNRFMFNFTMEQFSTFSGASQTLFWVTVFPATLKTLSLLLLATGIAKTTRMVVMMMIVMTMTMMVMMMMINICLRTCKTPDNRKIDQQLHKKANPEKSRNILRRSRDWKLRLIPIPKIPGSRDFYKSRPENPGIEIVDPASRAWSWWKQLVCRRIHTVSMCFLKLPAAVQEYLHCFLHCSQTKGFSSLHCNVNQHVAFQIRSNDS